MKCVKEGVLRLSLSGDNASVFVFRLYPDSTRPSGWAKSTDKGDMFEQAGPGLNLLPTSVNLGRILKTVILNI